ncbi:MAG TPA: hypothetical protein PLX97_06530, partial [Gemmatales bacterium]|nr:hypothetical protein [Gemmatales bacterium]
HIRRWKGVIDVGYGAKEIDKKFAYQRKEKEDVLSLVVFVEEKGDHHRRKVIPKTWKGFPTDVREAVKAEYTSSSGGDEIEAVGLPKTGTMGVVVEVKATGGGKTKIGLTNAHVIYDSVNEPAGNGTNRKIKDNTSNTTIGQAAVNGYETARHDCASIQIANGVSVELLKAGGVPVTFKSANSETDDDADVSAFGAISKRMRGNVRVQGAVVVIDGQRFKECIEIDGKSGGHFGTGGDSGSLLYDEADKRSLGLFFAAAGNRGYAVTLANVCDALGLDL